VDDLTCRGFVLRPFVVRDSLGEAAKSSADERQAKTEERRGEIQWRVQQLGAPLRPTVEADRRIGEQRLEQRAVGGAKGLDAELGRGQERTRWRGSKNERPACQKIAPSAGLARSGRTLLVDR
jgi:hypothetical protein